MKPSPARYREVLPAVRQAVAMPFSTRRVASGCLIAGLVARFLRFALTFLAVSLALAPAMATQQSAPAHANSSGPDGLSKGNGSAKHCAVPDDLAAIEDPLPGMAGALRDSKVNVTVVVLGPQESGAKHAVSGAVAYPARLQARLSEGFAAELGDRRLSIETVGKARGSVGELAALIDKQVLPLKPVLVIWQVGRTDARRGNPPYRFDQSLAEGLERLREQRIDTILMEPSYHPQFEALFRTEDYRNHLRWLSGNRDLPLLRRYDMIEHWQSKGLLDLDSADKDVQRESFDIIQECIAFQAARMVIGGVALVAKPVAQNPIEPNRVEPKR